MSIVSVADARNHFSDVIARAKGEAVFIERRGRRAAVVISPEQDERMLEALEDAEDADSVRRGDGRRGAEYSVGAGQGGLGLGLTYRIELRSAAVRALNQIDPQDRDRTLGAIVLLGEDPRPPEAKALHGRPGSRVRVGDYRFGDYRIVDTIHDDVLLIVVVMLGHRREVYER